MDLNDMFKQAVIGIIREEYNRSVGEAVLYAIRNSPEIQSAIGEQVQAYIDQSSKELVREAVYGVLEEEHFGNTIEQAVQSVVEEAMNNLDWESTARDSVEQVVENMELSVKVGTW